MKSLMVKMTSFYMAEKPADRQTKSVMKELDVTIRTKIWLPLYVQTVYQLSESGKYR